MTNCKWIAARNTLRDGVWMARDIFGVFGIVGVVILMAVILESAPPTITFILKIIGLTLIGLMAAGMAWGFSLLIRDTYIKNLSACRRERSHDYPGVYIDLEN